MVSGPTASIFMSLAAAGMRMALEKYADVTPDDCRRLCSAVGATGGRSTSRADGRGCSVDGRASPAVAPRELAVDSAELPRVNRRPTCVGDVVASASPAAPPPPPPPCRRGLMTGSL